MDGIINLKQLTERMTDYETKNELQNIFFKALMEVLAEMGLNIYVINQDLQIAYKNSNNSIPKPLMEKLLGEVGKNQFIKRQVTKTREFIISPFETKGRKVRSIILVSYKRGDA
jgi:hypothetical protein